MLRTCGSFYCDIEVSFSTVIQTTPVITAEPRSSWRDEAALEPWLAEIDRRHACFLSTYRLIIATERSLRNFCFGNGLHFFGLQRHEGGTWYREWAPAAEAASLIGDFNDWDETRHPCTKDEGTGVFAVFVPDRQDGTPSRYFAQAML